MHSFTLTAFVCALIMLRSSLAHPLQTDPHAHGHPGANNNGISLASPHSHPQAQPVVHSQPNSQNNELGPRFLSRRWEGSLPSENSPSDPDNTVKSPHLGQISRIPKVKRHDRILSPTVTNSGSCNSEIPPLDNI
jgi:hypothetical protein